VSGPKAPPVVLLSRNVYASLHHGDRWLVPTDEVDIRLVTHPYGGTTGLDPVRFPEVSVCDTNDEQQVLAVCHWLVRQHGAGRIVAVHERMLIPAAKVRDAHGLPGMDLKTTLLFRDKVAMKRAVAAAGAAEVPRFAELRGPEDLDAFDWSTGRKVLKSRWGVGAEDVHVVTTRAEADAVLASVDATEDGWEIEEYVEGVMYHCDSVVQDGEVRFAAVSEYLAKPGDFAPGAAAGSVLVGHADPVRGRIRETNARVLRALGLRDGVTHLEIFRTPTDALVFCEVAARPGGGGIDRILERAYGCNISEAAYRIGAGVDPRLGADAASRPADGAWAVIGFYPDEAAAPQGDGTTPAHGIPEDRFAALGIVEHVRSDAAGSGPGGVRHCVDYRDRYVVGAADRDALDARLAAVRRSYRPARP
jgi:hypothetical protein